MEPTSLHSPSSLPLHLFPSKLNPESAKWARIRRPRTGVFAAVRREAHDHHHHDHQNFSGGGERLVDASMIILRKRIHEMKMVERNYEPPSDWMEWEKQYFASYDSLICEMMGVLQSVLMNTRPGLALGMMALILLSLPMSTAVLFSYFVEVTKMIFSDGFSL